MMVGKFVEFFFQVNWVNDSNKYVNRARTRIERTRITTYILRYIYYIYIISSYDSLYVFELIFKHILYTYRGDIINY